LQDVLYAGKEGRCLFQERTRNNCLQGILGCIQDHRAAVIGMDAERDKNFSNSFYYCINSHPTRFAKGLVTSGHDDPRGYGSTEP
jgi:hypothetical protein